MVTNFNLSIQLGRLQKWLFKVKYVYLWISKKEYYKVVLAGRPVSSVSVKLCVCVCCRLTFTASYYRANLRGVEGAYKVAYRCSRAAMIDKQMECLFICCFNFTKITFLSAFKSTQILAKGYYSYKWRKLHTTLNLQMFCQFFARL